MSNDGIRSILEAKIQEVRSTETSVPDMTVPPEDVTDRVTRPFRPRTDGGHLLEHSPRNRWLVAVGG